jgi:hypothetical protein
MLERTAFILNTAQRGDATPLGAALDAIRGETK